MDIKEPTKRMDSYQGYRRSRQKPDERKVMEALKKYDQERFNYR